MGVHHRTNPIRAGQHGQDRLPSHLLGGRVARSAWAVEGAAGLGHGVAQQLVAAGERVVDVLAKVADRARLLGSGSARKTDLTDAVSVASVAIHNPKLSVVAAEDHTVGLRLLSDRRDDVVSQRTRTMNRLQVLLRNLEPGGAPRQLSTTAAAAFLARVRPLTLADQQRKSIARRPPRRSSAGRPPARGHGQTIATEVAGSGTTLAGIHGLGSILAAKIIGHASLVTRFGSKSHFASYTGTAPVEASSGDIRRHRLNRAGNRQLNTALHTAAVVQARDAGPGRSITSARSPSSRHRRKPSAASSANSPTSSIGTSSTTTSGTTSAPPLDTEAPVGHFRPTGQYEWVSGPGRRIVIKTTLTSRASARIRWVRPGPAPTRTLVSLTAWVVDTGALPSSLPGVRGVPAAPSGGRWPQEPECGSMDSFREPAVVTVLTTTRNRAR